jgi:hypothetical protein
MVMNESEATSRYREGINKVGIDAYRRAAQENTASGAAEILANAKEERLSADDMAESYRKNY